MFHLGIVVVLVLVVLYLVVWRVGSIMLELTGLEPRKASFQALSALTQTGFTTRESELVVSHDQRRKIVSFLIIFGHAGFASVVAVLAQSLFSKNTLEMGGNLLALIVLAVLIWYLAAQRGINVRVTEFIRRRLQHTASTRPLACEEMLHLAEGYGIAEVTLTARHGNTLTGRTLAQLGLASRDILVLAIQKADGPLQPAPSSGSLLSPDDTLICYGKMDSIRRLAHEPDEFLRPRRPRPPRRRRPPRDASAPAQAAGEDSSPGSTG